MAAPDRQSKPDIHRSEQSVQNWSFDEIYKVLATIPVVENNGALYRLQGDSTGKLKVAGLTAGVDYDYIDVQQTNSTTETYVYKTGGTGGTTVQTVVVVYNDDSKNDIDSVTWS